MSTCKCGREEVNGRCFHCEQQAAKSSYSKESYLQTAAKVRREYGEKAYNVFIFEYEKYKEAKKEGSEAYEGYIANVLADISAILRANSTSFKRW
jgi:SepF-like predicted cell division protein (DUF552 family)